MQRQWYEPPGVKYEYNPSAALAAVLILINLSAKATPGALWGGLATARGLLYHTCALTNLILLPESGPEGPNDSGLEGGESML